MSMFRPTGYLVPYRPDIPKTDTEKFNDYLDSLKKNNILHRLKAAQDKYYLEKLKENIERNTNGTDR